MLSEGAPIARASALEFRVPSSRGPRAGDPYDHNVIVRLDATGPAGAIQGVGEAAPRGRAVTGDTPRGSWRFIEAALDRLEGVPIPADPARARTEISALLADIRQTAAGSASSRHPEPPFRGMLAGLDAALVDLAAKAAGVPLAEFLGGTRRPVGVAGVVNGQAPVARFRRHIRSCARCPAVKVAGVTDRETALDAALTVVAEAGPSMPIWLELTGPLEISELRKLVESLADRVVAGELPGHIVVQRPADAAGHGGLGELQAAADHLVPPGPAGPGIVLMADIISADDAPAVADGGVRGVHLNPQLVGGSLALLDIAEDICARQPSIRLGLSTSHLASEVGARALVELATALPRLDYCAMWPTTIGEPAKLTPSLTFDEQSQVVPGEGAGLGGELALAPAVHRLTRYAQGSRTPARPPTFEGHPMNRFDSRPLAPFTNARGGMRSASPLLERAALRLGLSTLRLSRNYFLADHPQLVTPLGFTPNTSPWIGEAAHRVTHDKELSRTILEEAGVPAPRGAAFEPGQIEEAVAYAASLSAPVVVKPRAGAHGTGVSTDLRTDADVRTAIATLNTTRFGKQPFVVEEFVPGDDYRLLVVGDRVVSVVMKRPASVVGDGRSTVVELVLHKNRWRLEHPHGRGCPLQFGRDSAYWLGKQDLTPDSIPEEGRVVRLGSAGNIAAGGESIEVLDETHESLLDLAVRAVQAIPGLDHAGLDIMGNHRVGLDGHPAGIVDINSKPATSFNHFPMFGTPRDVSVDLVRRSCALAGFEPPAELRGELAVRIEVAGRVQGVGYREWFARQATAAGAVGAVRNLGAGGVEVLVAGRAQDVSSLVTSTIIGPPRAAVNRVSATHVADVQPSDRFEVQE